MPSPCFTVRQHMYVYVYTVKVTETLMKDVIQNITLILVIYFSDTVFEMSYA